MTEAEAKAFQAFVQSLRKVKVCERCGGDVSKEFMFCPWCGVEQ